MAVLKRRDAAQIDRYGVETDKAVDKICRQLLEYGVVTEGYGGHVPIVPVSFLVQFAWS